MGPLDPNWRPDTTGRRLARIWIARRGALLAATLFAPIGLLAIRTAPLVIVAATVWVLVVRRWGIPRTP